MPAPMATNGNDGAIPISRRPLIELPLPGDTTDSNSSVGSDVTLEAGQDQEPDDIPVFLRSHAE